MEIALLRSFLDSCEEVKQIMKYFPELPAGLSQRHIKAISALKMLSERQEIVYVGDVSTMMHGTRPSITKLIRELEQHGAVCRQMSAKDSRRVQLTLTDLGETYYGKYCTDYQSWLANTLGEIPPEQFQTVIETIQHVHRLLQEHSYEDREE